MNTNDATSQPTTLRSKVISFFNSFISLAQTEVANDTALSSLPPIQQDKNSSAVAQDVIGETTSTMTIATTDSNEKRRLEYKKHEEKALKKARKEFDETILFFNSFMQQLGTWRRQLFINTF